MQGAEIVPGGVSYAVWAPGHSEIGVDVWEATGGDKRRVSLQRDDDGYHRVIDEEGRAGDLYQISLGNEKTYPCPASRWQPHGLNGPSLVVDPWRFPWSDKSWARPSFRDLVIYELHVGTFTQGGTFRSAIEKLALLRDVGVNAIELMPIADFPGERNWGYDGVRLYAPAKAYGHPDNLRALVDAAHHQGIAVILDVVYNHFGPSGNFLREFSPHYFQSRQQTPWGEAINFDGRNSKPVRDFFVGNVVYWMEEFHIDGFRVDATHTIFDNWPRHILQEIAETVHARGGYVIAEDERNDARLVERREHDGYGLDALWADDFHHSIEVSTVELSTYAAAFKGELDELADLLEHGWSYRGRVYRKRGEPRGTACNHLPPEHFIYCLSNHDQIGNRAFGERLHQMAPPETWRAASALLCLAPYTPLLFMGQEWSASSPFLYFTDHDEELGALVEEGRYREFEWIFSEAKKAGRNIPSPQSRATFDGSKLNWEEREAEPHAGCLRLYKELLALRRAHRAFRPAGRCGFQVAALGFGILAMRLGDDQSEWLILCDLHGEHDGSLGGEKIAALPAGRRWKRVLSSNETRFGGSSELSRDNYDEAGAHVRFAHPEAVVLRSTE